MNLNPDAIANFYKSLEVMGQGMAGIFAVVAVFYGMIVLLDKLMPPKGEEAGK